MSKRQWQGEKFERKLSESDIDFLLTLSSVSQSCIVFAVINAVLLSGNIFFKPNALQILKSRAIVCCIVMIIDVSLLVLLSSYHI